MEETKRTYVRPSIAFCETFARQTRKIFDEHKMAFIRFCLFHKEQIDARGIFTPIIGNVVRVDDDISSRLPLCLLFLMPGIDVDAKLRVVNF